MRPHTIEDFKRWKREGRRFACLTAYDAPSARIVHEAGIPLMLVGDSLGNVILGYRDTVPVTLDEMLHHVRAARRGAPDAFIVADMPFLSFQVDSADALRNAGRLIKEGRADAVKLEGGASQAQTVARLRDAGVAVMGHLGLTPQSAVVLGGHRVQGTDAAGAERILRDAVELDEAGAFSIVLECVPSEVAKIISERVSVPTVGIGAGSGCDAQILVLHDMLGFKGQFHPRFVRCYAELEEVMGQAVKAFAEDVERGEYPSAEESFAMPSEELDRLREKLGEEDA